MNTRFKGEKMTSMKALGSGSECPVRPPGVLRLYSNRFCPFAKRTHLLLEYKDIPYEVLNINLADKPQWFLDKGYSVGTVPAIETDEGFVYGSDIINEYLDAIYTEKKLLPVEPLQVAKDKMLADLWSKVLQHCGKLYTCPAGKEIAIIPDLLGALDNIEKALKSRSGPYLGGHSPAIIDFHIWPHMERIIHYTDWFDGCNLHDSRFKSLNSWTRAISAIPAVQKTQTPFALFKYFMESVKNGKPNYDVGIDD